VKDPAWNGEWRAATTRAGDRWSAEVAIPFTTLGMAAPSASNKQPWHFVLIRDRNVLDEIPKFHRYAQMLHQADFAIVVCGDLSLQEEGFLVQDCSAATQNILLAAHSLGLGAVWLGVYPSGYRMGDVRALLGLPENVIPVSIVSAGYPAETKEPACRFDVLRSPAVAAASPDTMSLDGT
jgi:nitroreductase